MDEVAWNLFLILIFPVATLSLFYWLWVIRIQLKPKHGRKLQKASLKVIFHYKVLEVIRFYGIRKGLFYYCLLVLMVLSWYLSLILLGVPSLLLVDVAFLIPMLVLMVFDARYYLLPDPLVYFLLWVGIFMAFMGSSSISLEDSVFGVMSLYLIMLGIYVIGFICYRQEVMGRGDLKYAAALGAWIGVEYIQLFLFLSAGFGAVYGVFYNYLVVENKKLIIPFGPFLGFSGIIIYFILKLS